MKIQYKITFGGRRINKRSVVTFLPTTGASTLTKKMREHKKVSSCKDCRYKMVPQRTKFQLFNKCHNCPIGSAIYARSGEGT